MTGTSFALASRRPTFALHHRLRRLVVVIRWVIGRRKRTSCVGVLDDRAHRTAAASARPGPPTATCRRSTRRQGTSTSRAVQRARPPRRPPARRPARRPRATRQGGSQSRDRDPRPSRDASLTGRLVRRGALATSVSFGRTIRPMTGTSSNTDLSTGDIDISRLHVTNVAAAQWRFEYGLLKSDGPLPPVAACCARCTAAAPSPPRPASSGSPFRPPLQVAALCSVKGLPSCRTTPRTPTGSRSPVQPRAAVRRDLDYGPSGRYRRNAGHPAADRQGALARQRHVRIPRSVLAAHR